jgi:site-specific recombinase XerD
MPEKSERVGERASIYKRGDVWWVNLQHGRRQIRRSLKTRNLKEARRRAVQLEHDLLNGTATPQRGALEPVPVAEVVAAYLRHCEAEDRAPRTITRYRGILDRLVEMAEDRGVSDLSGIDHIFMDEYRRRRKAAGRKPKTIYTEVVLIRQLVLFAHRRGMIAQDPLVGLKMKKPKATPQPCWTPEQVERILSAAREPQKTVFTLLSETGVRIGELKWLTWDDIDLHNNVIHIRPKPGWTTKTGNIRAVPLSVRARQVLETSPRQGRWVLTAPPSARYPQGGRQISERRLLAALKRLLERLKLQGHLHTFRHSFISRAVVRGVPEAIIRQWVGHVDPEILRLYTHIADKQSQQAMSRLEDSGKDVNSNDPTKKGDLP